MRPLYFLGGRTQYHSIQGYLSLFLGSCTLGSHLVLCVIYQACCRLTFLYLSPSALMILLWYFHASFEDLEIILFLPGHNQAQKFLFFSFQFPKLLSRKQVAETFLLGSSHIYSLKISLSLSFSWQRVFSSLRKYEIFPSSINMLTLCSVLSSAIRT